MQKYTRGELFDAAMSAVPVSLLFLYWMRPRAQLKKYKQSHWPKISLEGGEGGECYFNERLFAHSGRCQKTGEVVGGLLGHTPSLSTNRRAPQSSKNLTKSITIRSGRYCHWLSQRVVQAIVLIHSGKENIWITTRSWRMKANIIGSFTFLIQFSLL